MYNSQHHTYTSGMSTVNVSEARKSFAAIIETAQREPVTLERRGTPQAVVLSPAEYERLLTAAEEGADTAAFDAAMAEEGPNIPWEQAKVDLGW